MIKGQDIVVLITLLFEEGDWTIAKIAGVLGLSDSQVHASLKRAEKAGLYSGRTKLPMITPLEEFLVHSLKYVFPAELGRPERGVPTSHSAPPLNQIFESEEMVVWPDGESSQRGIGLTPIHKSVLSAVKYHPKIYKIFALVDAIRIGKARERAAGIKELSKILKQ